MEISPWESMIGEAAMIPQMLSRQSVSKEDELKIAINQSIC
jgi:hypothetical protein